MQQGHQTVGENVDYGEHGDFSGRYLSQLVRALVFSNFLYASEAWTLRERKEENKRSWDVVLEKNVEPIPD